jgi:thiol-disulfide isomerase/thioredoxin
VLKFISFFSFILSLYANPLFAQDTVMVKGSIVDANRKETTLTTKKVNYIGMVYPRIYEKTITGQPFNGLSLRDSILVLNFWDTHCPPCVAEMPGLNKLQNDYKNKPVAFIALCMDDPKIVLEKFVVNKRFELRQLFYNDEIKKQNFYCAPGYPTTIIVDRNSKVVYITEGGTIKESAPQEIYDKIAPELDKLLK